MSINEHNYDEYLIRYMENELDEEERKEVELYMLLSDEAAGEWSILKKTKLEPDHNIVFKNKAVLYRSEGPAATTIIRKMNRWYAVSAAAAVAAIVFAFVLGRNSLNRPAPVIAAVEQPAAAKTEVQENPAPVATVETPEVTKEPVKIAAEPKSQVATVHEPKPLEKEKITVKPLIRDETPVKPQLAQVNEMPKVKQVSNPHKEIQAEVEQTVDTKEAYSDNTKWAAAAASPKDENIKEDASLLKNLTGFFKKSVKIEREKVNDRSVIALSFQTENISISKKFRSNL